MKGVLTPSWFFVVVVEVVVNGSLCQRGVTLNGRHYLTHFNW